MGTRLLIGFAPFEGVDLADYLLKNKIVEFCYNANSFDEDVKLDTPDNIHFPKRYGKSAQYAKFCDIGALSALGEDDLTAAQKYMPMYMDLCIRLTNFPITVYEEEKIKFYFHWRFWKHIFQKYEINAVFFENVPHSRPYHYVIYALALEHKIPMLVLTDFTIPNVTFYGCTIESIGENVKTYYEEVAKKMDAKDCILDGKIKDFFEKYAKDNLHDIMSQKYRDSERKRITKGCYSYHLSPLSFLHPYKAAFDRLFRVRSSFYAGNVRAKREDIIPKLISERRTEKRIKDYIRYDITDYKKYNMLAEEPDLNKPYIYFALQLTPEATTLPLAGVFGAQITSIQLIAKAAEKCGVMVYVKEHYVQAFRSRWFYKELMRIPNVRMIKTTVSSNILIKNCLAVATQTGTCILESAFRGKPALTTSSGSILKGFPNKYQITDEEQGARIIQALQKGIVIDLDDIKRYFYAIQKCTIFTCTRTWEKDPREDMAEAYWNGILSESNLIKAFFDA